jgi:hypothetical protein
MKLNNNEVQVLTELRDRVRANAGGGGCCHLVADEIETLFGWPRFSGSYLATSGDVICSAHVWNLLPDGAVLDATADQFGETEMVRVVESDSLDHRRYRLEWYEEFNPGTHPNIPQPLRAWAGELDGEQETRLLKERGRAWWLADTNLLDLFTAVQTRLGAEYALKLGRPSSTAAGTNIPSSYTY